MYHTTVDGIGRRSQVAVWLGKGQALMKGHSHPGAFETLGLQSVDIGGRECTIHILLKYVAPVFAAKILQEEKSIVIAQLVYVVKKNLSTFINF